MISYIIIAVLSFCSTLLQQVLQLQFQVSLLILNIDILHIIFTSIKIHSIMDRTLLPCVSF